MTEAMTPDEAAAHFTRSDGSFHFARWGRPVAPVVFGVDDATLATIKGAFEAVALLAGHPLSETDPEIGSNFMMFLFRDWSELRDVPDLDRMIPELGALIDRLEAAQANQYRLFRFDARGAIRAAFVFLRMDAALSDLPAETLALDQVVQGFLLWSDRAFRARSPLARAGDRTILRPEVAALIRAAYDPVLPDSARDSSHALRLAARMQLQQAAEDAGGS